MELFRITQERFADDLTGNGSRLFGGRWNSEGTFAVYTSSSRSLALLEVMAHTPAKMFNAKNYQLVTLRVPDIIIAEEILFSQLPAGWDAPDARLYTKKLGDKFFKENKGLMLATPSVIMREEINYILNPLHAEMRKVTIINKRRIYFDKRLNESF
ncbi:MAG: RES family NAD+ phosphorylase [Ginsengibacter sp.]